MGFPVGLTSTLALGLPTGEATQSATRTSPIDVINSIGSIILSGIAIGRIPKERLGVPTLPADAGRTATVPNAEPKWYEKTENLLLIGGAILLMVVLFLARKGT